MGNLSQNSHKNACIGFKVLSKPDLASKEIRNRYLVDAAKLQNLTKEHDTQEFQVLWIMRRHSRSRFLISFPMSFCLPNRILGIVKRLEI